MSNAENKPRVILILQYLLNNTDDLHTVTIAQNADFAGLDEKIMLINDQLAIIAQLRQKGLMDEETFRTKSNELNSSLNSLRSQRRLFLNNNEADKAITDIKKLIGIIDKGPDKLTEFDEDIFEKIVTEITADESEIIQFKLIGGLVIKEKIERKKRK